MAPATFRPSWSKPDGCVHFWNSVMPKTGFMCNDMVTDHPPKRSDRVSSGDLGQRGDDLRADSDIAVTNGPKGSSSRNLPSGGSFAPTPVRPRPVPMAREIDGTALHHHTSMKYDISAAPPR